MEIAGKVFEVLQKTSGTGKNGNAWQKQEFVLEIPGQYPKKVLMALWVEKVDQYNIQKGEELQVSFDIDCREYNGRWYNDIKAWNVQRKAAQTSSAPVTSAADVDDIILNQDIALDASSGGEDLPF